MKYEFSKRKTFLSIAVIILAFLVIVSWLQSQKTQNDSSPVLTDTQIALDTVVTISLYDTDNEDILNGAFELCKSYETIFSRTAENSELYQFNQSGKLSFTASDDLTSLIKTGLQYSKISDGSFDISIAPVSSLWDFKADNPTVPEPSLIQAAVKNVNYKNITVNGNVISRATENTQIDLGAIAKGYIADKIKDYLLSKNVTSAVINLGGNILLVGSRPDGSNFNVGIQAPFEEQDKTIAVLKTSDKSIVTSGIYERYFIQDDTLYHHILNPKTGYPYNNDLLSVTIISDLSVDGDALSTTCFTMGLEKGLAYINEHDNLDAIFITKDGTKHYSDKIFEHYDITETSS